MSSARASAAGRRLGRFHLSEPIGAGPIGEVFRASVFGVAGYDRVFAVKRFHPSLVSDPEIAGQLAQAARRYGALEHPRIARMAEFGVIGEETFTAVEMVVGVDGGALIEATWARGRPLANGAAAAIIAGAARAVGFAHGRGLAHLGLCPTNVVLTRDGDLKVTDFGLLPARLGRRPADDPTLAARLPYVAPEQLADEGSSPATDVWQLGAIAFELFTGARPFGQSPAEAAERALGGALEPLELPKALATVVRRALARSPFERFPDAGALADAIDAAIRGLPLRGDRRDVAEVVEAALGAREILAGASGALRLPMPAPLPSTDRRSPPVSMPPPTPTPPPRSTPTPPPRSTPTPLPRLTERFRGESRSMAPIPAPDAPPARTLPDDPSNGPTLDESALELDESGPIDASGVDVADVGEFETLPTMQRDAPAALADVGTASSGVTPLPAPMPLGSRTESLPPPIPGQRPIALRDPRDAGNDGAVVDVGVANVEPERSIEPEREVNDGTSTLVRTAPAPVRSGRLMSALRAVAAAVLLGGLAVAGYVGHDLVFGRRAPEEAASPRALAPPTPPRTQAAKVGAEPANHAASAAPAAPAPAAPPPTASVAPAAPAPAAPAPAAPATAATAPAPVPVAPAITETPAGRADGARSGKLSIRSRPPRAQVYLDGTAVGRTPLELDATDDRHRLAVVLPGYRLHVAEVAGSGAVDVALAEVTPPNGPGGVKVRCRNKGRYYVILDGVDTGQLCPTERLGVEQGVHTVEVYDPVSDSRRTFSADVQQTRLSVRIRVD